MNKEVKFGDIQKDFDALNSDTNQSNYIYGNNDWVETTKHIKSIEVTLTSLPLIWRLYGYINEQTLELAEELIEGVNYIGCIDKHKHRLKRVYEHILLNTDDNTTLDVNFENKREWCISLAKGYLNEN